MPKHAYSLESGGPKRLELSWSMGWKNFEVRLDGERVGTIANAALLKAGQSFAVSVDGASRTLHVQLAQSFGNVQLRLSLDGEPIPGSGADPATHVKTAAGIVYFIGGLTLVGGLVAFLFNVELLLRLGLGIESAIGGIFFLVLGYFVGKRHSAIALGIAIGLFAIDGIYSLIMVAEAGGRPPIGGLIFRAFLIIGMARGFPAIKALKRKAAETYPSTSVGGSRRDQTDPFDPPMR